MEAGFSTIYSIEIDNEKYEKCLKRFENINYVYLHKGDSGVVLGKIMMKLDAPATFWLDSHFGESNSYCPLIDELGILRKHYIKNHTILIDDIRLFGKGWCDIYEENILNQIMQINQNYRIRYIDGYTNDDILVAEI